VGGGGTPKKLPRQFAHWLAMTDFGGVRILRFAQNDTGVGCHHKGGFGSMAAGVNPALRCSVVGLYL